MHTAQFQIRRSGTKWEDTAPEYSLSSPLDDRGDLMRKAHIFAEALALETGRETRFSIDNSTQGHYTYPAA